MTQFQTDQVEDRLQQLRTREPSAEFDDRMARLFATTGQPDTVVPEAAGTLRGGGWNRTTLSTLLTAVLCLVFGVVIGRVSAGRAADDVAARPPADVAVGHSDSRDHRNIAEGTGGGSADGSPAMALQLPAPQVAMLCSLGLGGQRVPADARCLSCHTGIDAVQDGFLKNHRQMFRNEACAQCHEDAQVWKRVDGGECGAGQRDFFSRPFCPFEDDFSPS